MNFGGPWGIIALVIVLVFVLLVLQALAVV